MYSEEIVARYTEGDCHLLAQAIHDLTGWQIAGVLDDDYCGHVFVLMPDGKCLDINGTTQRRTMVKRWSWYGNSKVHRFDRAYDLVSGYGWPSVVIDLETRMIAAELVQEYSPEKG